MNIAKSLILGSAATLVALGGAQAADLPLKAKAVEYVKVCSLYGAGFYYIPGTDTCIKLGGYVMADTTFNGAGAYDLPRWTGAATRNSNDYISRSRFATTLDTRTATEYGVVRTYASLTYSWTTDTSGRAGGELGVYYAFIQFAGFTFGKAVSQFDMPWSGYPGNQSSFLLGGYDDVTGINQIAYTAQFGNGVSASVSLEENSGNKNTAAYARADLAVNSYTRGALYDLGVGFGAAAANNWGGTNVPDIVGQLRVDQAWGLFQLSAAAHQLRAGEPLVSPVPSDAWGFAVQAGLSLKNIPTGAGDSINVSAGYSNGALRYILGGVSPADNYAIGNRDVLATGFGSDGVYSAAFGIQKTDAYGVRGAFNHNWDPYWSSSLFGAWSAVRYNNTAKAAIGFNPDFDLSQIGVVTRWTPVKNLTLSGEVMYTYLTQNRTGLVNATAVAGDRGTVSFSVRAKRDF